MLREWRAFQRIGRAAAFAAALLFGYALFVIAEGGSVGARLKALVAVSSSLAIVCLLRARWLRQQP